MNGFSIFGNKKDEKAAYEGASLANVQSVDNSKPMGQAPGTEKPDVKKDSPTPTGNSYLDKLKDHPGFSGTDVLPADAAAKVEVKEDLCVTQKATRLSGKMCDLDICMKRLDEEINRLTGDFKHFEQVLKPISNLKDVTVDYRDAASFVNDREDTDSPIVKDYISRIDLVRNLETRIIDLSTNLSRIRSTLDIW